MPSEIVFIESPLQLKSALKVTSDHTDLMVVCRLNGEANNDFRIRSSVRAAGIECRFFVALPGSAWGLIKLVLYVAYVRLRRLFGLKKTTVFIGDYRAFWMRVCTSLFTLRYVNVVDDGLAIIPVVAKLDGVLAKRGSFFRLISPTVSFHTMFDIKADWVNIIYIPVKRFVDVRKIDHSIAYFIGAPLVEKGIVTGQAYKSLIAEISNHFSKNHSSIREVIYIPHRAELEKNYLPSLEAQNIFSVKPLSEDIESYISGLILMPACVASFYSTALYMLIESGADVKSFMIPRNLVAEKFSKGVTQVYDFYQMLEGVEVVEL